MDSNLIFFIITISILGMCAVIDFKTFKVNNYWTYSLILVSLLFYYDNLLNLLLWLSIGYILMFISWKSNIWGGADSKILIGLVPTIAYYSTSIIEGFMFLLAYYIIFIIVLSLVFGFLSLMCRDKNLKIPVFLIFALSYGIFCSQVL